MVRLRDQRQLTVAEAHQPCGLAEEPAVPLAAPERELGYYVGGGQRERVLGKEADAEGVIAVLHSVETGGRAAAGDIEIGAVGGAARDVGVSRGGRWVKDRVLLLVAVGDAWLALDPCDVAPGVEDDGLVPLRGAESDGDDVVSGTYRAAGPHWDLRSHLRPPLPVQLGRGSSGGDPAAE